MKQPVRLIVGLGNPGNEYARTRHNAGARLVEALASAHGASLQHEKRFFGALARVVIASQEVRLLIPSTFMNRSGQAVAAVAQAAGGAMVSVARGTGPMQGATPFHLYRTDREERLSDPGTRRAYSAPSGE